MSVPSNCYHCGQAVPPGFDEHVPILGQPRRMCCHGCAAVARAIVSGGHESFYRHRDGASPNAEAVPDFLREARVYDNAEVQRSFVKQTAEGSREAALILEGITCAACVWLNEQHLRALPGLLDVQVNYATHRARVRWDPLRLRLSDILAAVNEIGYRAHPYHPDRHQALLEQERRQHLRRLGLAGILGMQVMTLAVGLYFGEAWGMDESLRRFFQWISLALTAPVLLYSAAPFLQAAWRDLRRRRAGMDVPVSLGIVGAFSASAWHTLQGQGHVYFDSVVMFTFFLLAARYFELAARKRSGEAGERLMQLAPAVATRIDADGGDQVVAVAELQLGDRLRVLPGHPVPTDGTVTAGTSSVDESLLSGESMPIPRTVGEAVVGGSLNVESPLEIRVTRLGQDTVVSQMLRLLDRAQAEKPRITQIADRAAAGFVLAVLGLATLVGLYWWQAAPEQWLPITVSVLVVTCPCALSLATPTAITAATGSLAGIHLLTTRALALETLARVSDLVFDKTGTLTHGRPRLTGVEPLTADASADAERLLAIAAALERHSEHPLARAIETAAGSARAEASDVLNTPGAGLSGWVEGRRYHLGTLDYVCGRCTGHCAEPSATPAGSQVYLADDQRLLARLTLRDRIRDDAAATVAALQRLGLRLHLMSGDHPSEVRAVAEELGIGEARSGLGPAGKLDALRQLQAEGAVVAMVGDGINDAPVLAGASVSIAMGQGTAVALASADMILTSGQLSRLPQAVAQARRTLRVIRQNLAWAIGYNALALPAAAAGLVSPWMAAVGMSLSSLLVIANASRLNRIRA